MKRIPRQRRSEACTVHITAALPRSLYDHVKMMSKVEKCTKSEFIRFLIELDMSMRGIHKFKHERQGTDNNKTLREVYGHGTNFEKDLS
jgi:hypothetical protein